MSGGQLVAAVVFGNILTGIFFLPILVWLTNVNWDREALKRRKKG